MQNEKLFNSFSKVSTEEWKEKIIKDLKGKKDYNDLIWKGESKIDVQPFYSENNTGNPAVYPAKAWRNCEYVNENDTAKAIVLAKEGLSKGAEAVHFKIKNGAKFDLELISAEFDLNTTLLFEVEVGAVALAEKYFKMH